MISNTHNFCHHPSQNEKNNIAVIVQSSSITAKTNPPTMDPFESNNGNTARIGTIHLIDATEPPSAKKPKKVLDLSNISSTNDLMSLKKEDPFMYYSIPGVRSATMLHRDIDIAHLRASTILPSSTRLEKVPRSSRISFECTPDLMLLGEDIWSEEDDDHDGDDQKEI